MKTTPLIIGRIIGVAVLLSALWGCAEKKPSISEKAPEALLNFGLERLERNDYETAERAFQAIKNRYPYSKQVITAELKMAESHIRRKDFDSALLVYYDFERLHPKDNNIPYVIYQEALCHFEQVSTIDREQTHVISAKKEVERLIKRFPDSKYANKARDYLRKCLVHLAEYELYVGHFYFKMGEYEAALLRYKYIIQNYPDTGQYHEALEYISKCEKRLAEQD
jgi:outer membrane protein assembly factor BamD